MRVFKRFAGCLLGVGLAGCTFFNEGNPRIPVSIRMPDGLTATDTGAGRRLSLPPAFGDQRLQRDYCGEQKVTYGLTPGKMVCIEPPGEALARLLAEHLRASGFEVRTEATASAGAVRIEGSLLRFFVEPVRRNDYETDIEVSLKASSATGLEAERRFFEKGRGSEIQRAINSGVRKFLTDAAAAITALLDRYPDLGAPPPFPRSQD